MSDDILDIKKIFKITQDTRYEFRHCFGFTFVFKTQITSFKDRISSAEIRPAGIIYEENGDYYFAPLHDMENIDEIVKEYVESQITVNPP